MIARTERRTPCLEVLDSVVALSVRLAVRRSFATFPKNQDALSCISVVLHISSFEIDSLGISLAAIDGRHALEKEKACIGKE